MSYKVKKGDNLSNIAKKNGMTLQQLLKLNPQIKNANSIGIGDTITLSNQSSKVNDVANYSYGQFQPEIPTDETTSWGRNQKLDYNRNQMMNKELDKSKKLLKEGAEQGKKDRAKLVKRQTQQMRGRSPEYLITTKRQQALKPYGYTGEIDGIWGRGSEAAYKKAKEAGYDFDDNGNLVKINSLNKSKLVAQSENQKIIPKTTGGAGYIPPAVYPDINNEITKFNLETAVDNSKKFAKNMMKNPSQAIIDGTLYLGDVLGLPTNATNYLRDLNISIPFRKDAALAGLWDTMVNDKSFKENYTNRLENPSWYTRATTIEPLTNSNINFNDQELAIIRDAAGTDFQINNADVKRVQEDGKYGASGAINSYFSPDRVVATSLGQTSGNKNDKMITDTFDVNVGTEVADRDNQNYLNKAKQNLNNKTYLTYENLRAIMPFLNMTSNMPDENKIHTKIKYEK